jgi:hypothetical protein
VQPEPSQSRLKNAELQVAGSGCEGAVGFRRMIPEYLDIPEPFQFDAPTCYWYYPLPMTKREPDGLGPRALNSLSHNKV